MSLRLFLFLAAIIALFPSNDCSKVRTIIESVDLRNCTTVQVQYPNYLTEVQVLRPKVDESFMKAKFVANVQGAKKLMGRNELFRCQDRSATECEYFLKGDFPNICGALLATDQMWTPFFNTSTPPFACPIPKGVYELTKIYPDISAGQKNMANIPFITEYYWLLRSSIIKAKKPWACVEYVARVINVKA